MSCCKFLTLPTFTPLPSLQLVAGDPRPNDGPHHVGLDPEVRERPGEPAAGPLGVVLGVALPEAEQRERRRRVLARRQLPLLRRNASAGRRSGSTTSSSRVGASSDWSAALSAGNSSCMSRTTGARAPSLTRDPGALPRTRSSWRRLRSLLPGSRIRAGSPPIQPASVPPALPKRRRPSRSSRPSTARGRARRGARARAPPRWRPRRPPRPSRVRFPEGPRPRGNASLKELARVQRGSESGRRGEQAAGPSPGRRAREAGRARAKPDDGRERREREARPTQEQVTSQEPASPRKAPRPLKNAALKNKPRTRRTIPDGLPGNGPRQAVADPGERRGRPCGTSCRGPSWLGGALLRRLLRRALAGSHAPSLAHKPLVHRQPQGMVEV